MKVSWVFMGFYGDLIMGFIYEKGEMFHNYVSYQRVMIPSLY